MNYVVDKSLVYAKSTIMPVLYAASYIFERSVSDRPLRKKTMSVAAPLKNKVCYLVSSAISLQGGALVLGRSPHELQNIVPRLHED